MRDDYPLKGKTKKLTVTLETQVVTTLKAMESYSHISVSELANTALKRFIAHHKDFLPPDHHKSGSGAKSS
ncbi:hypothetical protein WDW37_18440 [Bdellovibrionota bacterium FG-1]